MPTLNLASKEYVDNKLLDTVKTELASEISGDAPDIDPVVQNAIDEHANDTSNPHNVTAEQIGAVTASYVDNALANVKIPMTVSQTDITAGVTELPDGALYLVIE
jgi:hypothetical protein